MTQFHRKKNCVSSMIVSDTIVLEIHDSIMFHRKKICVLSIVVYDTILLTVGIILTSFHYDSTYNLLK